MTVLMLGIATVVWNCSREEMANVFALSCNPNVIVNKNTIFSLQIFYCFANFWTPFRLLSCNNTKCSTKVSNIIFSLEKFAAFLCKKQSNFAKVFNISERRITDAIPLKLVSSNWTPQASASPDASYSLCRVNIMAGSSTVPQILRLNIGSNGSCNGLRIRCFDMQHCHEMLFSTTIYYPSTTNGKLLLSADILTLVSHNGKKWAGLQTCQKLRLNPTIYCSQQSCDENWEMYWAFEGPCSTWLPYFVTNL